MKSCFFLFSFGHEEFWIDFFYCTCCLAGSDDYKLRRLFYLISLTNLLLTDGVSSRGRKTISGPLFSLPIFYSVVLSELGNFNNFCYTKQIAVINLYDMFSFGLNRFKISLSTTWWFDHVKSFKVLKHPSFILHQCSPSEQKWRQLNQQNKALKGYSDKKKNCELVLQWSYRTFPCAASIVYCLPVF